MAYWRWADDLEVVPYYSAVLVFSTPAGAPVQPAINIYDLKKALKTVTKDDPVHSEFDLRRERNVAKVGYSMQEPAELLHSTLHGRTVPIGLAKLQVHVKLASAAGRRDDWRARFFKGEADASKTVQEELFKRAPPGKRPDTLVFRNLPCKWFNVSVGEESDEEEEETKERGEQEEEEEEERRLTANTEALTKRMEPLGWVSRAEAMPPAGGEPLMCDAYVQFRKFGDVVDALERFESSRAVRYVPSGMMMPLEVEVDHSGFLSDEAVEARREAGRQARQQRRAFRKRRGELQQERMEFANTLERFRTQAQEAGKEVEEEVDAALEQAEKGLAQARQMDVKPSGGVGPKVLDNLAAVQSRLKGQVKEAERVLKGALEAAEARAAQERERRRRDEVNELRMRRAKDYKKLEQQWVDVVEDEKHAAAADTEYCRAAMEGVEKALAATKELLLQEGGSIKDLDAYAERVEALLKEADELAAAAAGRLALQAKLLPLEGLLKEVEEGVAEVDAEAAGAAGPGAGTGKRRRRPVDEMALSDSEESEGPGEEEGWRWPFARVFSADPHVGESIRRARAAMEAVGEEREAGRYGKKVSKAAEELDFHVCKVLRPRLRRHRAVLPWATKLEELTSANAEVVGRVGDAVAAAEAAVKRAHKGVAGGEGQEAREQQLFDNMRDAVMRVEGAIATEERRREEWEREEEERRRTEEQRAEEEGRANAQARLEELERRKAFIIESLRVQKARERLKEIREGKVQAAAAIKVAATRLLHASGIALGSRTKSEDEGASVASGAADGTSSVADESSMASDSASRGVPTSDRWRMATPLNQVPRFPKRCIPNEVSKAFWAREEEAAAAGPAAEAPATHGPPLASEVYVVPKSEQSQAPPMPAAPFRDEHDRRRMTGYKRQRPPPPPSWPSPVRLPARRGIVEVVGEDGDVNGDGEEDGGARRRPRLRGAVVLASET